MDFFSNKRKTYFSKIGKADNITGMRCLYLGVTDIILVLIYSHYQKNEMPLSVFASSTRGGA
jgi:hypothetical protein